MTKIQDKTADDYIVPLNMNGLQGRMLRVPAVKRHNREILVIYGHHAMIERWWGLVENLRVYGAVTMPDMPGFGGMDSFYKIGVKPNIDAYADYLASFIKLRYRNRRLTIVAASYGFVVVTRMLQRHPELTSKVDFVVGLVGFVHKDDFVFKPFSRKFFRILAGLFATRPAATIIRYCFLNKFVIRFGYANLSVGKKRYVEVGKEQFQELIAFDTKLWQLNDVRTHWQTTREFLNLDNCAHTIDLPIWHVIASSDHYFNNDIVEQHMKIVFSEYHRAVAKLPSHTPNLLADKEEIGKLLPRNLRRALAKQM